MWVKFGPRPLISCLYFNNIEQFPWQWKIAIPWQFPTHSGGAPRHLANEKEIETDMEWLSTGELWWPIPTIYSCVMQTIWNCEYELMVYDVHRLICWDYSSFWTRVSTGHFSWTRPDPTRRNVDPTRPDPRLPTKSLTRPDPTRGPTLPQYV